MTLKPDIDHPLEKAAYAVVETLQEAGYESYWVGGCVRNALLGLPFEDVDAATAARPEEVLEIFPRAVTVGARFGVVVVLFGEFQIEVATFRSDEAYIDGRHPQGVVFSDPETDARRRDFTVNALFWNPVTGELKDYVGGREDLEARIIRCIGDAKARFREDALRLMRAVRFAARFSFRIEKVTWEALKNNAALIEKISMERVRDELVKMLTGPNPGCALELLEKSGLLELILPEVHALNELPQPKEFHPTKDCFEHTKIALEWLRDPSPTLAMGCLLHDVGKPPTFEIADRIRFSKHSEVGAKMADAICRRLRFSTARREAIVDLVSRHMKFIPVKEMKKSTLKRFLSHPNIEEDLELHRADCLASHGTLENYYYAREKLEEFQKEEKKVIPPPLLRGKDLIDMGYKPGPIFSTILDRVEEAQLEGEIKSGEEARSLVEKEFPQG